MDYRQQFALEPSTLERGRCQSYNSDRSLSPICRCASVSPIDRSFSSGSLTPPAIQVNGQYIAYIQENQFMEVENEIMMGLFAIDTKIKTFKLAKCISKDSITSFINYFVDMKISDNADFLEMFDLAAAFKVPVLKQSCVKAIKNNIYQYEAIEIFNLGHFHASKELKETGFAIIQETFPDLENNYINAPHTINRLVNSISEIVDFMP